MVNGDPIKKIDGSGRAVIKVSGNTVTKVDCYPVITGNICSFSSI